MWKKIFPRLIWKGGELKTFRNVVLLCVSECWRATLTFGLCFMVGVCWQERRIQVTWCLNAYMLNLPPFSSWKTSSLFSPVSPLPVGSSCERTYRIATCWTKCVFVGVMLFGDAFGSTTLRRPSIRFCNNWQFSHFDIHTTLITGHTFLPLSWWQDRNYSSE